MEMTLDDACRILHISPDASPETVTVAYRKTAFDYHPDRVASLPEEFRNLATEKLKEINAAYEILSGKRPAAAGSSQSARSTSTAAARNIHRDVAERIKAESQAVLSKLVGIYNGRLCRTVTADDTIQSMDKVFVWPSIPSGKFLASRKLTFKTYGTEDVLLLVLESSVFFSAGFLVTADGLLHFKNELQPQRTMHLRDIQHLQVERPSVFNFMSWRIHINGTETIELDDTRDEIEIEIFVNVLRSLSAYFR